MGNSGIFTKYYDILYNCNRYPLESPTAGDKQLDRYSHPYKPFLHILEIPVFHEHKGFNHDFQRWKHFNPCWNHGPRRDFIFIQFYSRYNCCNECIQLKWYKIGFNPQVLVIYYGILEHIGNDCTKGIFNQIHGHHPRQWSFWTPMPWLRGWLVELVGGSCSAYQCNTCINSPQSQNRPIWKLGSRTNEYLHVYFANCGGEQTNANTALTHSESSEF